MSGCANRAAALKAKANRNMILFMIVIVKKITLPDRRTTKAKFHEGYQKVNQKFVWSMTPWLNNEK